MNKYEKNKAVYDSLISVNPNIERKGKTMPYTSANGYMFSQLNKAGEIGIRLSKDVGDALMEKHNTTKFKSYGSFMKDYVLIPESMFEDLAFLSSVLQQGLEHVMSLPPK